MPTISSESWILIGQKGLATVQLQIRYCFYSNGLFKWVKKKLASRESILLISNLFVMTDIYSGNIQLVSESVNRLSC